MTAEQFLQSGVCDHRRIVDQVRDESGRMLGRTFTIRDCDLEGGIYYAEYSDSTNLPTWEITNSRVNGWLMFSPVRVIASRVFVESGAYWVPCASCGAEDHQPNQTQRAMPVDVRDSLFWKALPDPTSPYHSEALHVVGSGTGYSFTNVRFVQEGPMNGTQTGALKFTGRNSTFRNVTFDFGGTPAASYFTVYFEGTNLTIDGCRIQQGVARPGYEFPDIWSDGNGYVVPSLTGCVDFDTGAPVG
jgi:hypothetical protein